MDINDRGWPTWSCVGLLVAVLCAILWHSCGCTGLQARIETIEQEVALFRQNVQIGGGADTCTSWMYAWIAGASVLYPIVIRPIRKRRERSRSGARTELDKSAL